MSVESLQPIGRYRRSELNPDQTDDPDTLLVLELDGAPLHIDHGYPVRLIGPNRPVVLQAKWVYPAGGCMTTTGATETTSRRGPIAGLVVGVPVMAGHGLCRARRAGRRPPHAPR